MSLSVLVEMFLEKLDVSILVLLLVFLVYWVMEWIKLVLKDKLKEVYIQPISLLIGAAITSFVMYAYEFVPINLGIPRFQWINYIFQGVVLTALTGVIYDKYLDKK